MAISAAEIERIRASLAAEPFTRQSVVGSVQEREVIRSYVSGLTAGQETDTWGGAPVLGPPAPSEAMPQPVPAVMTPEPAQEIGMETAYDGVATNGIAADGITDDLGGAAAPAAIPTAFPLVAGVAMMSVAAIRRLLILYGAKILKALIGVAAFKEFMDIVSGKTWGTDETQIPIRPGEPGRKRRYSIGSNPRVRTLQRVSRHCQKLLKRHEKVIREFLPRRQGLPARALARTYLSTAERKALGT